METAMGYCGTVGVDAVREDAMERLRNLVNEFGLEIIHDSSVDDGDILFNPNLRIVAVGDYIQEKNIDVLLSML